MKLSPSFFSWAGEINAPAESAKSGKSSVGSAFAAPSQQTKTKVINKEFIPRMLSAAGKFRILCCTFIDGISPSEIVLLSFHFSRSAQVIVVFDNPGVRERPKGALSRIIILTVWIEIRRASSVIYALLRGTLTTDRVTGNMSAS